MGLFMVQIAALKNNAHVSQHVIKDAKTVLTQGAHFKVTSFQLTAPRITGVEFNH